MERQKRKLTMKSTLARRIFFVLLIVQLFAMPFLISALLHGSQMATKSLFKDNAFLTSRMIVDLMMQPNIKDEQQLTLIMDSLALSGNVTYANLRYSDRSIISDFSDFQADDIVFIEDEQFDQHDDNLFFLSLPLNLFAAQHSGNIELGFDEQITQELLAESRRWTIFTGVVYSLLVLGLMLKVSHSVTRPISELQNRAQRISDGVWEQSLTINSSITEVHHLGEHLEHMRGQLVSLTNHLDHLSRFDTLTQLPNRRIFNETLVDAVSQAQENGGGFSVMLLDLDRFKEVNDTHGHYIGDIVLTTIAQRYLSVISDKNIIARMGGDEFAIIIKQPGTERALQLANKLLEQTEAPLHVDSISIDISASIGIACFPEHGNDRGSILKYADYAMYEAKRSGTRAVLFQDTMAQSIREENILRQDFKQALDNGDIEVYYQPKIDLDTGRICALEALSRWHHPTLGFISPPVFVEVAENIGLIDDFTFYVMAIAFKDTMSWRERGFDIGIAVNIESSNLLCPDFEQQVFALIDQYKIPINVVEIELTENHDILDRKDSITKLQILSDGGVSIGVDDFGTGYSSLSYLWQLPVSTLKLDKSFILNLDTSLQNYAIVEATIKLAHRIGLRVVAEGVETLGCQSMLKDMNCEIGQGFYYSRPVPEKKIFDLLCENRLDYQKSQMEFSSAIV